MADIAASAENNGKQDAALFTKPISWNAERYNNGFLAGVARDSGYAGRAAGA